MKKEKLPDGFPVEQDEPFDHYPCDNCGKTFDANEMGYEGFGLGDDGHYHNYTFCSEKCVFEFATDNGLDVSGGGDDDFEFASRTKAKLQKRIPMTLAFRLMNRRLANWI